VCYAIVNCVDAECLQLTDNEALVCETVCQSELPLAFSEVKRFVGLRQKIVSRILRRLQKHGVIEKVSGRYKRKTSQRVV
jgi:DNA-binding HxlR family transcriptional regulator